MKRILFFLPAIALFVVSVSGVLNISAGKPASDLPVTTTIEGLGVGASPTLRVQSDQAGAYKNSTNLESLLQGALGDWVLDTLNSPSRRVFIDLRDPVPGSGPNGSDPIAPFEYLQVKARLIAKCSQFGSDMRTIPGSATIYCPLAIAFDDAAGVRYRLAMNSDNFPEVNLIQITCLATANSKCSQWKIEPSAMQLNGERKNVAKLLKVATRPHQTDQDMGDFYLSFAINLTNP